MAAATRAACSQTPGVSTTLTIGGTRDGTPFPLDTNRQRTLDGASWPADGAVRLRQLSPGEPGPTITATPAPGRSEVLQRG